MIKLTKVFEEFDDITQELGGFSSKMDKIFDKFSGIFDDLDTSKDNIIKVPLPGVGKENITVTLDSDNILSIKYKGQDDTERKVSYRVSGYTDAKAEYKDGILIITLAPEKKKEEKTINID